MKFSIKINVFFSAHTTVIKKTQSPLGKIKGKTFAPRAHKNSAGDSSFPALFLYRLVQMIISLWVMGVLMNFLDGREAVSRLSALWLKEIFAATLTQTVFRALRSLSRKVLCAHIRLQQKKNDSAVRAGRCDTNYSSRAVSTAASHSSSGKHYALKTVCAA